MKFITIWGSTSIVRLLLLLVISLRTSVAGQAKTVFKVAVLYDLSMSVLSGDERAFHLMREKENLTRFLVGNEPNIGRFSVDFQVYPLQGLSPASITNLLCKKIIDEGVSVIALHTKEKALTRYVAHVASQFWIPTIGSVSKDALLSEKNVYKSFLRTVPSETLQLQVILEFLKYTGNAEAFVVVSDENSYGLALEFFSAIDFVSITILKIATKTTYQSDVARYLMQIKASLAKTVFLYCDVELAKIILWSAKDFRMFQNDFFWIVSEDVVQDTRELYTLPSGIHAISTEHLNRNGFYLERLQDTRALLYKALNSSSDDELLRFSTNPSKCSEMRDWKHGQELYRKLISTSARSVDSRMLVTLDAQGNRDNFIYDMLYLKEAVNYEKRWITTGKWIDRRLSLRASTLREHGSGVIGLPVLRAAVVEYPPLTMKSPYDPNIGCTQGIVCVKYIGESDNYTKHCCYGLAIDVLNYVKSELEFEPFVYFVRDGNYGAKNTSSNQWNGIVRDLVTGQADISIDLMTNEARSEVVDFSQRWTEAGLALLVLVGEKKVDAIDFAFLDPFTMELWLGIVGIVNIYLVVLWVTDRLSPYGCYQTNERDSSKNNVFNLDGSMWFSWGVCFDNQFVEEKPGSFSSRAMAVCLSMFALLCLTSYTANLTAHLVSDDTKPFITGIRDPKITAEDSKLTFGVVKSSFVDSYFELNQDSVMQSLFERMLNRGHLVQNFTDGVNRVKERKLDIFISEILSLDYEVAKQKTDGYPRLQVVGASKTFADTGYSYSFRKNSTWKPKFDLVVNKLKSENKPSDLYKKWVRSGKIKADESHERLNEQSLSGVFFVGVSLSVISFIFLFFENKLYNMGLIYRDLSRRAKNDDRGRRRLSVEIHRKLLSDIRNVVKKEENSDFPDISNYLEESRKQRASIHKLHSRTGSIKSRKVDKFESYSSSPTSTV